MKTKLVTRISVLVALLLLTSSALAMRSTHYWLDWFTPLTGGGGGPASSTHYAVNLTVGQVAIGSSASASYAAGLGYWYGAVGPLRLYLPLVLRQSP
jgi:hypothetical protein